MPLSVILSGNKHMSRRALLRLLKMCFQGQFQIIGKTNWEQESGKKLFEKVPEISPEEISGELCDLILIFNWDSYGEITSFLLKQPGITWDHIIPGWLLSDQKFDLERYRLLRNSKISILSNTCWGGFLSKTLGIEHRSPTKNCWFTDDDYLKMLRSPEHYLLECEPVFDHWEDAYGMYDAKRYPVLRLDDILVFCNHDTDPEAAIYTWTRRRKKLDLENIFVEYSPYNRDYEKEFSMLERYPRKLCLVPWETTIPCSQQIRQVSSDSQIGAVIHTALPWGFKAYYSPIELLLTGEHHPVAKPDLLFRSYAQIKSYTSKRSNAKDCVDSK